MNGEDAKRPADVPAFTLDVVSWLWKGPNGEFIYQAPGMLKVIQTTSELFATIGIKENTSAAYRMVKSQLEIPEPESEDPSLPAPNKLRSKKRSR